MALIFSANQGRSIKQGAPLSDEGMFVRGDNGCAAILIHGLTGTPNEVKFLGVSMNKKGYTVICPRLKNHGAPLDVLKDTKWEDFYQSVRDAYMKVKDGHRFIFVSGLSMGALLALLLADEFRNLAARAGRRFHNRDIGDCDDHDRQAYLMRGSNTA